MYTKRHAAHTALVRLAYRTANSYNPGAFPDTRQSTPSHSPACPVDLVSTHLGHCMSKPACSGAAAAQHGRQDGMVLLNAPQQPRRRPLLLFWHSAAAGGHVGGATQACGRGGTSDACNAAGGGGRAGALERRRHMARRRLGPCHALEHLVLNATVGCQKIRPCQAPNVTPSGGECEGCGRIDSLSQSS